MEKIGGWLVTVASENPCAVTNIVASPAGRAPTVLIRTVGARPAGDDPPSVSNEIGICSIQLSYKSCREY